VAESIDQWHFGTNPSSTTVRLSVIDLLPAGGSSNVELQGETPRDDSASRERISSAGGSDDATN
jgi:hypothetical protein